MKLMKNKVFQRFEKQSFPKLLNESEKGVEKAKIFQKKWLLFCIFFLCCISIVSANLEINDVDVSPNKAKPDERVEITVEIENNGNLDIEDIELEIQLLDDDGDVVEDEDDEELEDDEEFDLDDGDDEELLFKFKIPSDADDDDEYIINIKACGIDDNNTEQCVLYNASETIKVKRDRHDVEIYSLVISPSTLSCYNDFEIRFGIKNIGKKDEDVKLKIVSDELNINKYKEFELEEGDRDDYKKSLEYVFTAPDDLTERNYRIEIRAEYNDEVEEKTLYLTKNKCLESKKQEQNNAIKSEKIDISVKQESIQKIKFQDSFDYIIMVIILTILILGLIIFAIGALIIKN